MEEEASIIIPLIVFAKMISQRGLPGPDAERTFLTLWTGFRGSSGVPAKVGRGVIRRGRAGV